MIWAVGAFVLYVVAAYVNAGFILAYMQDDTKYGEDFNRWYYLKDWRFAVLYSTLLGPVSWSLTLFLTGFYRRGWMAPHRLEREVQRATDA